MNLNLKGWVRNQPIPNKKKIGLKFGQILAAILIIASILFYISEFLSGLHEKPLMQRSAAKTAYSISAVFLFNNFLLSYFCKFLPSALIPAITSVGNA